ncbi:MAG: zeta toxin family protein, partial [Deltaproteobacteria bacterium]|nr:zeta toxin family protein [Deltaproteobacteria bacterium]
SEQKSHNKSARGDNSERAFYEGTLSAPLWGAFQSPVLWAGIQPPFTRHKLLEAGVTFTFETVMSSPDKVAFLKKAQEFGFRTYLYYVATEDPEINISRVESRVAEGGHSVPRDKIVERYRRSLDLLADAVQYANRAYIFDNSSDKKVWVAEVTDGDLLELKSDTVPYWFKTALWDKFTPEVELAV